MFSPKIQSLIALLSRFPGFGPRQAGRFVYHLLDEKKEFVDALAAHITALKNIRRCSRCFQAYEDTALQCRLCRSEIRDARRVMVVEKDMDLNNIEKTAIYDGLYYILGGVISPLKPELQNRLRLRELFRRVESDFVVSEVILATSITPEGDHTARYVEKILEPLLQKRKFTISRLGRGLASGAELEYSDPETFKNAYMNRK